MKRFACSIHGIGVLLAVAVLPLCGAENAWLHKDALCRLRLGVRSRRGQQLHVMLPAPLNGAVKGVAAYTGGKTKVAASLVDLPDDQVAIWLAVGRQRNKTSAALPVEIYLFGDKREPVPLREEARRPARFWRTTRSLLTRPFTAEEAMLMMASVLGEDGSVYSFDIQGPGKTIDRPTWQHPPDRRSAVMLWTTEVAFAEQEEVLFGSDRSLVAWFTFVDGKPVAGWRTAAAVKGGTFWGKPVRISKGLHQVQFFVVQRSNEPIPACLWRRPDAKAEPLSGCLPTASPAALDVQFAPELLAAGFRVGVVKRYICEDTQTNILWSRVVDVTGKPFAAEAFTALFGGADAVLSPPDGIVVRGLLLPGPALTVAQKNGKKRVLHFPSRLAWMPGMRLVASLRFGDMPVVLSAADLLPLAVELTFSRKLEKGLLARIEVVAQFKDADGKIMDRRLVAKGEEGMLRRDLPVPPEAVAVDVVCRVAGAAIARPRVLRIVRPGASFASIRAAGPSLFQGGDQVVLVCHPLSHPPSVDADISRDDKPLRLGILDDFMAIFDAPDAVLTPETILGEGRTVAPVVFRESVRPAAATGILPEAARFAALSRLLEMRPDDVVLAVGAPDVRGQGRLEDLCRSLLFLSQATTAAGARPVFMALPRLPGVSAARSRRAALLCKELAWRLGAPVVDAHSATTLEQREIFGPLFADCFVSADGNLDLEVPNDTGRAWIYHLIGECLNHLDAPSGR